LRELWSDLHHILCLIAPIPLDQQLVAEKGS
jgi:hypothetical protein